MQKKTQRTEIVKDAEEGDKKTGEREGSRKLNGEMKASRCWS